MNKRIDYKNPPKKIPRRVWLEWYVTGFFEINPKVFNKVTEALEFGLHPTTDIYLFNEDGVAQFVIF